jgi:hypothetical protein
LEPNKISDSEENSFEEVFPFKLVLLLAMTRAQQAQPLAVIKPTVIIWKPHVDNVTNF